ncbi:hypothetical protein PVAP13_1KG160931 [Panicum virgatum]|uniref:Uncharacterized protein n=1 Tax=Panicum virgatum TaxID=38727 RepID=A0A8T0XDL2_PANVG|nr:hypothetical protein PVAP13_1KG160931 [Panicum virgatum]
MVRTKLTARKSTRGPPHPIQHPQETTEPEESNHVPEFVMVDDNDASVNFDGHHEGEWVDTETEEEPMELPEDHPAAAEDSGEEDTAKGSSPDPDAAEGEDAPGDSSDDPAAPEDGGNDPNDDPETATVADTPPPEPYYEKEVHHLDFAEGPIPTLLWRAMQRIGFPLRPRYEAHLYKSAKQEEEWIVAVVISVPDEKYGSRKVYYKHFDDVPRRILEAGTSEAARRALYSLCHIYKEEL